MSKYSVVDEGNCSPRFLRLTCNHIGKKASLMDQTKLCIGAIVQPLAELGPNEPALGVVDHSHGPIRCERCRAYINPFFKFVNVGRKFQCCFCHTINDVPEWYYCNLDGNNERRDKFDRPELSRGSVEFNVGEDFMRRPIQKPHFLFVIDVSYAAVVSGLVDVAVDAVRNALDTLEENERTHAGILTYDSSIHFYRMSTSLADPQMLEITDTKDPFIPAPTSELVMQVSDAKCRYLLDTTLDLISTTFSTENVSASSKPVCVGSAALAASQVLQHVGGKVLFIQANLPGAGVGVLTNREDAKLYNTKKEKNLFIPQGAYYTTLARQCAEQAITFDLYVCANCYVDLCTFGELANTTGGQICLYPGFSGSKDGEALTEDIQRNVSRLTGYDAVMIVRCSAGLRVADQYGNYYLRTRPEMDLPSVDCDKTFGIRFEHDGDLDEKKEAVIQVALLYTTPEGARRIRSHTISVPVTSVLANIFRNSDLDSVVNLSLKQAVRQIHRNSTPQESAHALTQACVDCLYTYRKRCASSTSSGQLILPEPLKLLPMCTLGMIKHPICKPGLSADERSFLHSYASGLPCYVARPFVCPRLFNISHIPEECCLPDADGRVFLPQPLTLSSEVMLPADLYLLENGRFIYLWISERVSVDEMEAVFGNTVQSQQYEVRTDGPPECQASRINTLVAEVRRNSSIFKGLQVIRAQDTSSQTQGFGGIQESLDEAAFFAKLLEDGKVKDGAVKRKLLEIPREEMSYVDFLCWLHKMIQNKFYA